MGSKLTAAEKKWIDGVQRALNKSGSGRIGFYTIGDNDLVIYNKDLEDEIDAHQETGAFDIGTCIDNVGARFGNILVFPTSIHSCAG